MSDSENIRVAIRCRPFNGRERDLNCESIVDVLGDKQISVRAIDATTEAKNFTFDFAYGMSSSQEDIYKDLGQPIVNKALDGFNSTLFAYGQTGSGKTFTMMGSPEIPGVIPRINEELFQQISGLQTDQNKFQVSVSYLEIYNEMVKDLLNPSDRALDIRENPKQGIYVDQLAVMVVHTHEDVLRLIEQGNTVRKVGD